MKATRKVGAYRAEMATEADRVREQSLPDVTLRRLSELIAVA